MVRKSAAKTTAAASEAHADSGSESKASQPQRVIKKYPNRRLYDTTTSSYVTLTEIKQLVMQGPNFCRQGCQNRRRPDPQPAASNHFGGRICGCAHVHRGRFGQHHSLLWACHAGPYGGIFREQFAISHVDAVQNGTSVSKHRESDARANAKANGSILECFWPQTLNLAPSMSKCTAWRCAVK